MRWALEEITISKRVLRLRACLYLKIRWVDTINIVNQLLGEGRLREVKDNKHWLAPPQYLDGAAQFREKYRDEFEKKKDVYDRWVRASSSAGYYAEELVKDAFIDVGYSAKKVLFQCPEGFFPDFSREVEIDVFCVKSKWHLGVQVKNVTSDVFINPGIIERPSKLYRFLMNEFDFCSRNRIIPVLIAPFVDSSFYVFNDQHKGLHCQTFLQLFEPEKEGLCNEVKDILHFGNLKSVSELPGHVKDWIKRIPDMWTERYGKW